MLTTVKNCNKVIVARGSDEEGEGGVAGHMHTGPFRAQTDWCSFTYVFLKVVRQDLFF